MKVVERVIGEETKSRIFNLEEWIHSRKEIARFDDIILKIRMFGFTFVPSLISVDTLIFIEVSGLLPIEKLTLSIATLALIFALFRIDRYHEIFLIGAVERAIELEKKLNFDISNKISYYIRNASTDEWGVGVYALLGLVTIISPILTTIQFNIANIAKYNIFIISMLIVAIIYFVSLWRYNVISHYELVKPDSLERKMLDNLQKEKLDLKKISEIKNEYGCSNETMSKAIYKLMRYHNVRKDKDCFIKEEKIADSTKFLLNLNRSKHIEEINKMLISIPKPS
jgi:hypothetical protein